jgi:hypothetical protein
MSDLPYLDAKDFRELHLLPRVIFSLGGIAFVGAFYVHSTWIGLIGLATVLIGVGLNLTVDVVISCAPRLWWWGSHKQSRVTRLPFSSSGILFFTIRCLHALVLTFPQICLDPRSHDQCWF